MTPALFGRFDAVLAQHRDLGAMLQRMRDDFAVLADSDKAKVDALTVLDDFITELRAHFTCEEDEQYFGTIGTDYPVLKAEVDRLLAEHEHLLAALEKLREAAREPSRHPELGTMLSAFCDQLRAHELAETRLLAEFFGLR